LKKKKKKKKKKVPLHQKKNKKSRLFQLGISPQNPKMTTWPLGGEQSASMEKREKEYKKFVLFSHKK